jgi:hypothetical protein
MVRLASASFITSLIVHRWLRRKNVDPIEVIAAAVRPVAGRGADLLVAAKAAVPAKVVGNFARKDCVLVKCRPAAMAGPLNEHRTNLAASAEDAGDPVDRVAVRDRRAEAKAIAVPREARADRSREIRCRRPRRPKPRPNRKTKSDRSATPPTL